MPKAPAGPTAPQQNNPPTLSWAHVKFTVEDFARQLTEMAEVGDQMGIYRFNDRFPELAEKMMFNDELMKIFFAAAERGKELNRRREARGQKGMRDQG